MVSDPQDEQKLKEITDTLHEGIDVLRDGEREIRYRSLEDLIKIKSLLKNALGYRKPKQSFFAKFRKGL